MVSSPVQLIDSQGLFKKKRLKNFLAQTHFPTRGESYSVVSIFGPQSSGKSTLLNELCGTNFEVRENFRQFQTTQGIWMAESDRIKPFTIAMDIEGTDGRAKEDNTTFDKQSALFALEISDVVLFNMWWHDIGRNQAAGRPLLEIILQFVVQLFKPRKTTLLFVLRDKTTQFSFKEVEGHLKHDICKIWKKVPKPDAHEKTPLSEFFKVEIVALSSYHGNKKQFKQEVAELRKRLFSSAPTSLGGPVTANRSVVSASDFSDNARRIWRQIRRIRDLNIPSIQEMVSTVRCDEIIKHLLDGLSPTQLDDAIQVGPQEFVERLRSILDTCCSKYVEETMNYDEHIRTDKRKELEAKALQLFQPAYASMLNHLFGKASENFNTSLEKSRNKGLDSATSLDIAEQFCVSEFKQGLEDVIGGANWGDSSAIRSILMEAITGHASRIKSTYQINSQRHSLHSAEIALRAASDIAQIAGAAVAAGTLIASGGACSIL